MACLIELSSVYSPAEQPKQQYRNNYVDYSWRIAYFLTNTSNKWMCKIQVPLSSLYNLQNILYTAQNTARLQN